MIADCWEACRSQDYYQASHKGGQLLLPSRGSNTIIELVSSEGSSSPRTPRLPSRADAAPAAAECPRRCTRLAIVLLTIGDAASRLDLRRNLSDNRTLKTLCKKSALCVSPRNETRHYQEASGLKCMAIQKALSMAIRPDTIRV